MRGLDKRFGRFDGVQALTDVSLRVEGGEIFGLVGPHEAGKTTLIRILATLLRPSEGTAEIGGFDVTLEGNQVREMIGYLPQNPFLGRKLSLRDYLRFWGKMDGLSEGQRRTRIAELLAFLELSEEASEMTRGSTAYTRQRLSLAQALLTEPEVLLLDDPVAGLTPAEGRWFMEKVEALRKDGRTILLSSPRLRDVQQVCGRVSAISEGKVTRAHETPLLLRALGEALHARVFVGIQSLPSRVLSILKGLPGVIEVRQTKTSAVLYVDPSTFSQEELERVLHTEKVGASSISVAEVTLGDVFRTLSGME